MRAVQASSRNEAVLQQAQNEVRSAEASIKFLEDELGKLQVSSGAGGSPMRSGGPSGSSSQVSGRGGGYANPQVMSPSRSSGSGRGGALAGGNGGSMSPSPSFGRDRPLPPPPGEEQPPQGAPVEVKPKNYTQLGGSFSAWATWLDH